MLASILFFLPQDAYGINISTIPATNNFGPNDWIQIMLEIDGYIGGEVEWTAHKPDGSTDSGLLGNFVAGKKTHSIPRNAYDNQFGTWSVEYRYKDVSETIALTVDPIILEVTTDKEYYLEDEIVISMITTNFYEPYSAYAETYFINILDDEDVPALQIGDISIKATQASITQEFSIKELLRNNPYGRYKVSVQYYNVFAKASFEVTTEDLSTSIFVGTDKVTYKPGEVVELNLAISNLVSSTVAVKIIDPFGKIIEQNFPIESTLTRIFLEDVSTNLPGNYLIEIEYANEKENKTFVVEEEIPVAASKDNIELKISFDKLHYRPGEVLNVNVSTDNLIANKVNYWFEDPTGNQKMKISMTMTGGNIIIPITIPKKAVEGPWKIYIDYGGNVRYTIFFVKGEPLDQPMVVSTEKDQGPELMMTTGDGETKLKNPHGIAIDSNQDIYLVDSANSQIKKFDANGILSRSWGNLGSGEGELKNPTGIFVDSDFVHVADTGNSRIQTFEKSGNFVRSWPDPRIESQALKSPVAISVDLSGIFYISDSSLNKILKYDSNGKYVGFIAPVLTTKAKFSSSDFIISDNKDNFFIVVSRDNRILQYSASGNFIKSFGTAGEDDGKFQDPSALAIDSKGYLYVADSGNSRIQVFDSNGKFLGKWGSLGTGPGQFNQISGIAVDSDDNVHVVDSANNRVQKFASFIEKDYLKIPNWVRNNAKWWTEGMIADKDFVSGIQFMIKEKIIMIPDLVESGESSGQKIPDWVKNNAKWWASGEISDKVFATGIEYLVEQGIIKV